MHAHSTVTLIRAFSSQLLFYDMTRPGRRKESRSCLKMQVVSRKERSSFPTMTALINVVPTAVEFGLVAGILGLQFEDKSFLLCTTATVGVYVLWSVAVTQYRTSLRQRMNRLDNESSAHVIDSLINYETVKYFNNERVESLKYGDIMNRYASAAIAVSSSLSVLNAGQNVIFTTGLAVMLYLACQGITAGTMTVGDLVLVNTLLFQLSVPLNFIGSVYREVKLALTDLETMMKITHTASAVRDDERKNPIDLVLDNGPSIEFKNVSFGYDMDIADQRYVAPLFLLNMYRFKR